jgi:hypothetical protein
MDRECLNRYHRNRAKYDLLLIPSSLHGSMKNKRVRKYPEKNCPTCGKLFAKQGKYCCRACGNSRTFTPTQKAKQSNLMRQKMADDPEYKREQVSHIRPDIPIPPQIESPLGLNQFISDGDLWTEV